jgi:hypothetical protein
LNKLESGDKNGHPNGMTNTCGGISAIHLASVPKTGLKSMQDLSQICVQQTGKRLA